MNMFKCQFCAKEVEEERGDVHALYCQIGSPSSPPLPDFAVDLGLLPLPPSPPLPGFEDVMREGRSQPSSSSPYTFDMGLLPPPTQAPSPLTIFGDLNIPSLSQQTTEEWLEGYELDNVNVLPKNMFPGEETDYSIGLAKRPPPTNGPTSKRIVRPWESGTGGQGQGQGGGQGLGQGLGLGQGEGQGPGNGAQASGQVPNVCPLLPGAGGLGQGLGAGQRPENGARAPGSVSNVNQDGHGPMQPAGPSFRADQGLPPAEIAPPRPVEEPLPQYINEAYRKNRENLFMIRARICPHCDSRYENREALFGHMVAAHWSQIGGGADPPKLPNPIRLELTRNYFQNAFRMYEIDLRAIHVADISALFQSFKKQYRRIVRELLADPASRNFKIQFYIRPHFYKEKDGRVIHKMPTFASFNYIVENQQYGDFAHRSARDYFEVRIGEFLEEASGWTIDQILDFTMIVSEYHPLMAGSKTLLPLCIAVKYRHIIDVPEGRSSNPKSRDNLCFLRCLIAYEYGDELKRRENGDINVNWRETAGSYLFYNRKEQEARRKFNLDGIDFPFHVKQAKKFELQNPGYGLNVIVYDENRTKINPFDEEEGEMDLVELKQQNLNMGWTERKMLYHQLRDSTYPARICRKKKKKIIDLLLVENGDKSHYLLITDLVGFLKYPNSKTKDICRHCFTGLDKMVKTHEQVCPALGLQKVSFPEDDFLEFNSHEKTIPALFTGSADFESILRPISKSCGNSTMTQQHIASSYSWAITDQHGHIAMNPGKEDEDPTPRVGSYVAVKEGENVTLRMIKELQKEADKMSNEVHSMNEFANRNRDLHLKDAPDLVPGQRCGFCKRVIPTGKAHRHHDHFPPYKFQFWSCNKCNLKSQTSDKLVIFLHNLSGYDSSFIIKACAALPARTKVEIIAYSLEKIFCINIGKNLVFLDSLNFFQSSLDNVTKMMDKKTDFLATREHFNRKFLDDPADLRKEKVELLLQKGIYPYSYFSSLDKYEETELPPIEAFKNDLKNEDCPAEDYAHAKKVWEKLNIKDLREYTQLYNEQDVMILSDGVNRLRRTFMESFGLDAAHFFSLPHLTWTACLKDTGIQLEYIKDETLYAWFSQSVRGGVAAGCELRAAKANNPMVGDYDDSKPTSYIMAFDLVNLYGAALSTKLPCSEFKWVGKYQMKEIREDLEGFIKKIDAKPNEGQFGYHFEVDAHFPPEIQDKLVGLTPMPYKRKIYYEELSPFQQQFAEELDVDKATMSTSRLITDFHPRRNYIVHYRVLQLYLELGIKVTKVHRAVTYRQSDKIASYISKLSQKRKDTKITFEQNLWKLSANAIYGKSVENVRDRSNFIVIRSREQALRYNKKATIAGVYLIDTDDGNDLAIVRMKKLAVTLSKPVYLGTTVLDEAKRILYQWYYKYALPKWDKGGRGFYSIATDTDSIYCLVETDNVYDDILADKEGFDMSAYDQTSPIWKKYYDGTNERCPGKMKDENGNMLIKEMIFLRAKSYYFTLVKAFGWKIPGVEDASVGSEVGDGGTGEASGVASQEMEVAGDGEQVGTNEKDSGTGGGDSGAGEAAGKEDSGTGGEKEKQKVTPNAEKLVMKQKGTPRSTLRQQVTKEMYQEALQYAVQHTLSSTGIVKKKHEIFTMFMLKKGLSGLDLKRYCLNEVLSYPFGYYLIHQPGFFVPPSQQEHHPNAICHADPSAPDDADGVEEEPREEVEEEDLDEEQRRARTWSTTQDLDEDYYTSCSEYEQDFIDDSALTQGTGPASQAISLASSRSSTSTLRQVRRRPLRPISAMSSSSFGSSAPSNYGSPSSAPMSIFSSLCSPSHQGCPTPQSPFHFASPAHCGPASPAPSANFSNFASPAPASPAPSIAFSPASFSNFASPYTNFGSPSPFGIPSPAPTPCPSQGYSNFGSYSVCSSPAPAYSPLSPSYFVCPSPYPSNFGSPSPSGSPASPNFASPSPHFNPNATARARDAETRGMLDELEVPLQHSMDDDPDSFWFC